MGLLEAIDESTIIALADPEDEDGNGISGCPAIIPDPENLEKFRLGRFTHKGTQVKVAHQVGRALAFDIGVTNPIYPSLDDEAPGGDPEINATELEMMRRYVSLLGVSARRSLTDPVALRGEQLFLSIGCNQCHTDTLTTGSNHPMSELRNQTIHPYTDLLLHDMGPGLADNMGESGVPGSEWRTSPLWNIGLSAGVSGGTAYLHDGRASSLEGAILWHGGEAEATKEAFRTLSKDDRDALITFLKSL